MKTENEDEDEDKQDDDDEEDGSAQLMLMLSQRKRNSFKLIIRQKVKSDGLTSAGARSFRCYLSTKTWWKAREAEVFRVLSGVLPERREMFLRRRL